GRPSKVHKYFQEWPLFVEMLYVEGEADVMWAHLERLLTDLTYAQKFALDSLSGQSDRNVCLQSLFQGN
ncbi:MAG: hypothetical protein AAF202_10910, partial [Pseudomonadota bacterium]